MVSFLSPDLLQILFGTAQSCSEQRSKQCFHLQNKSLFLNRIVQKQSLCTAVLSTIFSKESSDFLLELVNR